MRCLRNEREPVVTEMVHDPHRSDLHQIAQAEYHPGSVTMSRQCEPGTGAWQLVVDAYDPVIICSAELIEALREGIPVAPHVLGDQLHILASNMDLTYKIRQLPCGCYLGDLVI